MQEIITSLKEISNELYLTGKYFLDPTFIYDDGAFWVNAIYACINLTTSFILMASFLSKRFRVWPNFHKVGISLVLIGVLAKSYNQTKYLFTGKYTSELEWPLQAFDNIGAWVIAVSYTILILRKK